MIDYLLIFQSVFCISISKMHIFLEESWTCSQQVDNRSVSRSRGFAYVSSMGCSGRPGVIESSDGTALSPSVDSYSSVEIDSFGIDSDSLQVLPIRTPDPEALSLILQDGLQTESDDSDSDVQIISLAPPEKWSDPDFMEDGEISGEEERERDVVVTGYSPNLSRWQQNCEGEKRSHEGDQKLPNRKRQRLDLDEGDKADQAQSSSPAEVSKSDPGPGPAQRSFDFSRLGEPNLPNRQSPGQRGQEDISPQYTLSTDVSLDDLMASSVESGSSQDSSEDQFTLVPLLRSIIEAQRKKTAELEGENNLLKSLFAKTLSEKNEALEMLRKSNQTLRTVTNASVVMADEMKALKTNLAEKDVQIKSLRSDAFTVRDCVNRMGRTFLKLQEIENQTLGQGSGEENPKTGHNLKQDSIKSLNGKTGTESDKISRSPSKLRNQDQVDQRGKGMAPPHPSKPSKIRRSLTLEEMYIMNKLADLNKWKYNIRDIRWVGGEYKCPQCGVEKKSLEAVAAHARDKHVWQQAAKFGKNRDRRSD